MKKLFLALGLLCARASPQDTFTQKFIAFHTQHIKFLQKLLGCPKDATHLEECKMPLGVYDVKEFQKARELAKEIYGFD